MLKPKINWCAKGVICENCNCRYLCRCHLSYRQPTDHECCVGCFALEITEGLWRLGILTVFLTIGLVSAWYGYRTLFPIADHLLNTGGGLVGGDFVVFYTAGVAAAAGQASTVYDVAAFADRQQTLLAMPIYGMPYVYPPTALFAWAPFAGLSYLHALWLWTSIMVLALAWCAWRLAGHWLGAVLAVISPIAVLSLAAGQTGAMLATLTALGLIHIRSKPLLAGGFLGLLAIKPHLAIALPICLIAGRYWRVILGAALSAVALHILAGVIFGFELWPPFLEALAGHSNKFLTQDNKHWARIPSVLVSVSRVAGSDLIGWIAQIVVGLGALGAAFFVWAKVEDPLLRVTALVTATILVTPKVMDYDLAILILPVSVAVGDIARGRMVPGILIIGVILWCFPYLSALSPILGWHPGPVIFSLLLAYTMFLACQQPTWRPRKERVSSPGQAEV